MPNIIKGHVVTVAENVFNPETPKITGIIREDEVFNEESTVEHCSKLILKATAEAEEILKNAKKEASHIKESIKKESAKEIEQAFEESKKKGYNEGYNNGVKESEDLKKKAKAELDTAIVERKKMQKQLEPEIFDLIIDILTKIFNEGNIINPQIIMYLIQQGLSETTITGNISIRVSEADYQTVMANKDKIAIDGSVELEIIKDMSLKESDCIIQTPFGSIDASLGQQLESLKNYLHFIFDNR